jgi:hypothetical protein
MKRLFVFVLFYFLPSAAFDPVDYIHLKHDKLYFGIGGGFLKTVGGAEFMDRFPGYSWAYLFQAGIGDYPFIFDIRYGVTQSDGVAESHISGLGAQLKEYSILSGFRTYLFWKHPRVKSYLLLAPLATEAQIISADVSGPNSAETPDGLRVGLCAGYGLELNTGGYGFADIELAYEYIPSNRFEGGRERLRINLLFNIGQ